MRLSVCERLSSRNVPFCSDTLKLLRSKQQRLLVQERGAVIILKGVGFARMTRGCVLWRAPIHPLACQRRGRGKKNDTSAQCLVQPRSQQARGQTLVSWMRVSCCSLVCSRIECSLDPRMEGSFVVLADSVDCAVSACVCVCVITRSL